MGAHCPPVGGPSPGFDAVRAQPPSPPKSSFYSITVKKRRIFLCGGGQHAGVCAKSPGGRPLPGHVPSSLRHPVEPEPRACPTPSTPPTPGYPARIHPSGPCVILPPTQRAPSTRSFPPGLVLVGWCGCAVAASATARRWHCVWGVCNGASLPPQTFVLIRVPKSVVSFFCGGDQHASMCAKSPGGSPPPGCVPSSPRYPVEPQPTACPTPSPHPPPSPG